MIGIESDSNQNNINLKQGKNDLVYNEKHKPINHRHRKKKFYNLIRQQMEFYFSDANLSKDRFLMKLIRKNPFVSLEEFLKFNKIKKLTNSVADIAKAIKNSSVLTVSEDGMKVQRKIQIVEYRNVDEKTIYVESLPPHVDHDWVIKVFSRFGSVSYVSLPKYRRSRKIKEFGFIEFENSSSVTKVLKTFKKFDGVLCPETLDPSNLMSIVSYIKENNDKNFEFEKTSNDVEVFENNLVKRKRESCSSDDENNITTAKKIKEPIEKITENKEVSNCLENEKKKEEEIEFDVKIKKNRKHKKRGYLKTTDESDFHELKILVKKDWKRLRNKYLNMQRDKVKEFKRMRICSQNQSQNSREPLKSNLKRQSCHVNFYCNDKNLNNSCKYGKIENVGNEQRFPESETEYSNNVAIEKEPRFQFEPGLIIRMKFYVPCVDVKSLKVDMKQYDCIKYVDVREGALESYLRCDSSSNADKTIKQLSCAEYQCQILSGIEEETYWQKIMKDREMKLNKKIKVKQKRGREKVMKSISQHIRFEDEE